MKERLFKTEVAKYVPATWAGTDTSGWTPIGSRIIVAPDKAESKTQGGIEIPIEVAARQSMAAEAGMLVSAGPDAFKGYNPRPNPGDRVYMERFAGQLLPGYDGNIYRLMEDACIGAVMQTEK